MPCGVASWLPIALADSVRAQDRCSAALLTWLGALRDDIEEYDALVLVRPETPESAADPATVSPDSAFDEILSQIGKEIFKLDEYQRNLNVNSKEEVSLSQSILDIFDECLCDIRSSQPLTNGDDHKVEDVRDGTISNDSEVIELIRSNSNIDIKVDINDCEDDVSDVESSLSDVSFVTSTPFRDEERERKSSMDSKKMFDSGTGIPVPPPRARLKTPSSTASSVYESIEFPKTSCVVNNNMKRDSDSESTCWSWKEYGTDTENEGRGDAYAEVWSHSSGYHRSDEIMRRVLSQNHAIESRLSFHKAYEWSPTQYPVYLLHEVGDNDRCEVVKPPVNMTPGNATDDGYEPVRDAIAMTEENVYEEIEYGYTDEGYSCAGSVEVESCSISASSEGVGRESPLYANLRDNDAYAMPADVIAWKNLLLHPYYNDDEEDEWITPEECALYSREQRPPLIIPRITQYRPPRYDRRPPHNHVAHSYPEENVQDAPPPLKSSGRQYERLQWSPISERSRVEIERGFAKASDSPPFARVNKRYGGSTENLINNMRRPNHLQLPASSSGDSLDVEIRDSSTRNRKSKSMVSPKHRVKSPVPAPRMLYPQHIEAAVIHEGAVKRTKFGENGKKCKKNWADCFMILTPTALVFYKDQKTYLATKIIKPPGTPPSPNAPRAELVLPLRNAHAVPCIATHTRRHTRSIKLVVDYDEYLLQDETEDGIKHWLNLIQTIIHRLGPPTTTEYLNYQSSNTDLESLGRTPPVSRHHPKTKQKAGGSSNEDLSDSTDPPLQKSQVRSILRKFFPKRPAMEVLVRKGIYKDEPVFGRNLDEVCPPSPSGIRVPEFVVACVKEIEKCEENMATDGLYRASGNLSQVQKIRLEVDQNNLSVLENYPDIHVLTGSLKLFFRELKEPLIPRSVFDRVLSACSIKPKEAKIREFKEIVQALPQCNRDTLKFLLEHLLRVTRYSESNRMHTANLAIVFGPTLLWAPAEQAHNIAIDCIQQNNVVDTLLTDYKEIFDDNSKGKKKS